LNVDLDFENFVMEFEIHYLNYYTYINCTIHLAFDFVG